MANKQSFLYDSDDGGFTNNPFNVTKPVLLRAAGLTACVPIYMAVGDCPNCRPADVLWEPVMSCGSAVELCPDNNQLLVSIPGKYSIGDPNDPSFTIPGDVNITKQEGVDPSLVGKCDGASAPAEPLEIETSCDAPLFVELCNQTPVETAMAELGCIVGLDGEFVGKVMICKITNELDGTETVTQTAYYTDGTVTPDYTGPWTICGEQPCAPEIVMGVITDLSVLATLPQ